MDTHEVRGPPLTITGSRCHATGVTVLARHTDLWGEADRSRGRFLLRVAGIVGWKEVPCQDLRLRLGGCRWAMMACTKPQPACPFTCPLACPATAAPTTETDRPRDPLVEGPPAGVADASE